MKSENKVIEKSPIPEPKVGRPRTTTYPYEVLKVEESFVAGPYSDELLQKVSSSNNYYGEKLGMKFVCRNVDGVLKVWRAE